MHDVIVIGGGPAGSAAAITAARHGASVLLLEAGRYPRHKVCGEFVSPEALGLLTSLLGDEGSALLGGAPRMKSARLLIDSHGFTAAIRPPAASITRYELDAALWKAALQCGVDCCQQVGAEAVARTHDAFQVRTSVDTWCARAVIDASGRWSKFSRSHTCQPAHGRKWLGLKAHYAAGEAHDSTDLYFFDGGYCGVQPAGDGLINVCAMVRADVASSLQEVFAQHRQLASASGTWRPVYEPLATSPLRFGPPRPLREGVLCAGDAAAFIDPFLGDGIALALRSGCAAAVACCRTGFNAAAASREYSAHYERRFLPTFRAAACLRRLLSLPPRLRAPFLPLLRVPRLADWLVKTTRAA